MNALIYSGTAIRIMHLDVLFGCPPKPASPRELPNQFKAPYIVFQLSSSKDGVEALMTIKAQVCEALSYNLPVWL